MGTVTDNISGGSGSTSDSTAARLPTRPGERIYKSYFSFLWSGVAFSASTLTYAIGGALPFVGNTSLAIIGYVCGLVICMVPTVLAGMPSYRYGIDTMDAVKTALGVRGAVVMLFGILASSLGWTFVLLALSSRGFGVLVHSVSGVGGDVNETYVVVFAFAMLLVLWALSNRGASGMERVTAMVAPGQLISAAILLGLLIYKFGLSELFHANVPADKAYTHDPAQSLALAFEFGFANVLTFIPFVGGLTRLVSSRKHVMGPMVTGCGIVGAGFVSMVASLAAVLSGTADPTVWVVSVGGRWFGSALLLFMLLANLGTMVVFVYIGAVASQQIRVLAGIRWSWLIAILLSPGVYLAFRTEWLLEKVIAFMTYNGLFFVGILAVVLTDYFLLRRQRINAAHVFTHSHNGAYWFWGGVNWIGILMAAFGCAVYLWMYDPVSLRTVGMFRYIGAGVPACLSTAVGYYLLMKVFVVRGRRGGYPEGRRYESSKIEVTL